MDTSTVPSCSFSDDFKMHCDVVERKAGRLTISGQIDHCLRQPELNLDVETERDGRRLLSFIAGNPTESRRVGHRFYPLDLQVDFAESRELPGEYKLKVCLETVKTGESTCFTNQSFPSIPRCAYASRIQFQTLISVAIISVFLSLVLLTILAAVFILYRRRRAFTLRKRQYRQESLTFIRVPPPLPGAKATNLGGGVKRKLWNSLTSLSAPPNGETRQKRYEKRRHTTRPDLFTIEEARLELDPEGRYSTLSSGSDSSSGSSSAYQISERGGLRRQGKRRVSLRENKTVQTSLVSLDTGVGLTSSSAPQSSGPASNTSDASGPTEAQSTMVVADLNFAPIHNCSTFKGAVVESSSESSFYDDTTSSPLDRRRPLRAITESDSL